MGEKNPLFDLYGTGIQQESPEPMENEPPKEPCECSTDPVQAVLDQH